jgi:RNA polymerase sigma factor (sigma-70 family)
MAEHASLDAIEAVYRSRATDFFRLALARLGDPELAQDAVQEGFARALRGRASFRGTGILEAWIARCVLNAAEDARRRRPHLALGGAPDVGAERAGEPAADIRAAIRRLAPRQRDVLFLRFYLDFDYRLIARALEIEVGTVSATLHAARTLLARAIEEEVAS